MNALRGALLVVALAALVGCGGGSDKKSGSGDKSETPTATATATATKDSGSDGTGRVAVKRVNAARLKLAAACKTLDDKSGDAAAMRDLRRSAAIYLAAFAAAPDKTFHRTDGGPEITMRKLLVATGAYVRAKCGGGRATAIGNRLSRAAHKRT